MLLCLAFGSKESSSKKAPNSAELPSYLPVLSAGLRELHLPTNVRSTCAYQVKYHGLMDWSNAGWKGTLEVQTPAQSRTITSTGSGWLWQLCAHRKTRCASSSSVSLQPTCVFMNVAICVAFMICSPPARSLEEER